MAREPRLGEINFVCIEIEIDWIQFSISKGEEEGEVIDRFSNVCFSLDYEDCYL